MANLRRGHAWCARLHIPQDRWGDVGRALGTKGGLKREAVRTLGTTVYREALRRREPALAATRTDIDNALQRARLRPLTDWTAGWEQRAVERREALRRHGHHVTGTYEVTTDAADVLEAEETAGTVIADLIERDADAVGRRRGRVARDGSERIALGRTLSIAQASREWLAGEEGRVRAGTVALLKATLGHLASYLAAHEGILRLEAADLAEVTRRMAGDFIAFRQTEVAAATVKREASTFNGLWRWAIRRGHAEQNPWTDQTAGLRETRGHRERGYMSAELVKLLRAGRADLAPSRGGYAATFWDLIRLALLTGARADELLALRVLRRVGGRNRCGRCCRAQGRAAGRQDGQRARIIPLHAFARRVIRDQVGVTAKGDRGYTAVA
ncbi:MAG: phage integrase SAM-like domain-containing protein [Alphaproteobacteria bacterium]|nr:phage integrase SAM-like domain-containing protein [Alphaproteobacteria bacterium]